MKVVALISGGKDSCYNIIECVRNGHEIVALANLRPPPSSGKDELDSYTFQTVGHEAIDAIGQAMELPLFRGDLIGRPVATEMHYTKPLDARDEVEDLYDLLSDVKRQMPLIEGVSVGAILSDYQRLRVELVCQKLGLKSLAYMWHRDQHDLLSDIIESGVTAVLVKVAACGLQHRHLGQTLNAMQQTLTTLHHTFELNVCGEGGEYETFTLDMPLFKKRIVVEDAEIVRVSEDKLAPVAYYRINRFSLVDKNSTDVGVQVPEEGSEEDAEMVSGMDSALYHDVEYGRECMETVEAMDTVHYTTQTPTEHTPNIHTHTPATDQHTYNTHTHVCFCDNSLYIEGLRGVNHTHTPPTDAAHSPPTASQQMQRVLDQLAQHLSAHALDTSHVTRVHLLVADMAQFAQVNAEYVRVFAERPPSRVCVQVPLPEGVLVQLHCVAHAPTSATDTSSRATRECLHVQSISRWCPANIGPYSQAVTLRGKVYLAGQIGMVPHTLAVVPSPREQAMLSLQHIKSVCDVVRSSAELVVGGLCYVSAVSHVPYAMDALRRLGMSSCCVVYAVVGCLPKNADVEWDLVAMTTDATNDVRGSDSEPSNAAEGNHGNLSEAGAPATLSYTPLKSLSTDSVTVDRDGDTTFSLVAINRTEVSGKHVSKCVQSVVAESVLRRRRTENGRIGSVRVYIPTALARIANIETSLQVAVDGLGVWCGVSTGASASAPAVGVIAVKCVAAVLGVGAPLRIGTDDVVIAITIE